MKPIIFSLVVSLSLLVSAPAKADNYLALIDLTYAIGKVVVVGAAVGVMYVGVTVVKAVTSSEKSEKMLSQPNDASPVTGEGELDADPSSGVAGK